MSGAAVRYPWAVEFYDPAERSRMRMLCATRAQARAYARALKAKTGGSAIVRGLVFAVTRDATTSPLERSPS